MEKMTEEEFYHWIAKEIKSKREQANLKTKELAQKVKVDSTFISKVEGGLKLSAYRIYEILFELGYTLEVVEKKKIYHIDVPEEDRDELIHITDVVDEGLKQMPDDANDELLASWSHFKAKLKTLLDVDVETILQEVRQDMKVRSNKTTSDKTTAD